MGILSWKYSSNGYEYQVFYPGSIQVMSTSILSWKYSSNGYEYQVFYPGSIQVTSTSIKYFILEVLK